MTKRIRVFFSLSIMLMFLLVSINQEIYAGSSLLSKAKAAIRKVQKQIKELTDLTKMGKKAIAAVKKLRAKLRSMRRNLTKRLYKAVIRMGKAAGKIFRNIRNWIRKRRAISRKKATRLISRAARLKKIKAPKVNTRKERRYFRRGKRALARARRRFRRKRYLLAKASAKTAIRRFKRIR